MIFTYGCSGYKTVTRRKIGMMLYKYYHHKVITTLNNLNLWRISCRWNGKAKAWTFFVQ